MEDGKREKRPQPLPQIGQTSLRETGRHVAYFCKHNTYYRDRKGRCPLYLPSARPTGNRPELLPTHLEKTFFKGTVRDKLDQNKQVPKLCQSSKNIFIHVNCPKIHPEKNPKCTRKNYCIYFLYSSKSDIRGNPSLFSSWIFKEIRFCDVYNIHTLGDMATQSSQ